MEPLKNKKPFQVKFEYKITAIYFSIGLLWILFSDTIFGILIENKQLLIKISIAKGFIYVIITSILLFYFVKNHMKKLRLAEQLINERNHYLKVQNEEYKKLNEELKKAKEKAEESDRLKTAFLRNVSHEIRTPLNAICGFAGILNTPNLTYEKRVNFTSIIRNSGNQLLSIISDILTISSLETKQAKLHPQKVSINSIIEELYTQFKPQAESKNISLQTLPMQTETNIEVYTDRAKVIQIMTNLLSNAVKFTHEGFIEYGYNIKDANLEFYVKDTGVGIETELHEKIFECFRQTDLSTNKKYGGTGLGLTISKGFVELFGGKIWVLSEPGEGSVFYFTVPYIPVNENGLNPQSMQQ